MPIEFITTASVEAPIGVLDETVYDTSSIPLDELVNPSVDRLNGYLDVPISRLVSLDRTDFVTPGWTWRQAHAGLTGRGWDDRASIINYFESELLDNEFPAKFSRHELRLHFVGGVAQCGNGNHRLVAAKIWLANRFGNDAYLSMAKCSYRPLNKALIPLLELAKEKNSSLMVSRVHSTETILRHQGITLYLYLESCKDHVFIFANGIISKLGRAPVKSILKLFHSSEKKSQYKEYSEIMNRSFQRLPKHIIPMLLDDKWIANSISDD